MGAQGREPCVCPVTLCSSASCREQATATRRAFPCATCVAAGQMEGCDEGLARGIPVLDLADDLPVTIEERPHAIDTAWDPDDHKDKEWPHAIDTAWDPDDHKDKERASCAPATAAVALPEKRDRAWFKPWQSRRHPPTNERHSAVKPAELETEWSEVSAFSCRAPRTPGAVSSSSSRISHEQAYYPDAMAITPIALNTGCGLLDPLGADGAPCSLLSAAPGEVTDEEEYETNPNIPSRHSPHPDHQLAPSTRCAFAAGPGRPGSRTKPTGRDAYVAGAETTPVCEFTLLPGPPSR
eukprot:NODE_12028_length_1250_cov_5.250223.p1 GENE.NODE_12028_length_1250_cov_5.250223~~NODE_12028_length_1250_cov_5.250223.p1  ORF type:complete len:296 (-),score=32.17 NODE_12028_length_1250_cov_5.250223:270-1157(-)